MERLVDEDHLGLMNFSSDNFLGMHDDHDYGLGRNKHEYPIDPADFWNPDGYNPDFWKSGEDPNK